MPVQYKAVVTAVIDGDTLVMENGEHVRLLGINAPEKGERGYGEAKEALANEVEGKEVTLEIGNRNRDPYNRQLRYVWAGGELLNALLVREGLASAYRVGEADQHTQILGQAQELAQTQGKGIWAYSTEQYATDHCLEIREFSFDAEGDDNVNPNGEKIVLQNHCNYAVGMEGWSVKDEATHIFVFPAVQLGAGGTLNIFSGKGLNYSNNLFMQNGSPVWNNDHDILFLRNEKGELVLYQAYEN